MDARLPAWLQPRPSGDSYRSAPATLRLAWTPLSCLPRRLQSPRNVTGSRSGLLKCFVRRENGPGGRRFTFHIGKDAAQPQRSRFLMAAKHVSAAGAVIFSPGGA